MTILGPAITECSLTPASGSLWRMVQTRALPTHSLMVLHQDRVLIERLHRAATPDYSLETVGCWSALRARLQHAPRNAIAVVDPYSGADICSSPSPDLRVLLHEFRSVPMLAAVALRRGCGRDLCVLGQWGIAGIIDIEADDTPEAVRRCLRQVRVHSLQAWVEGVVGTAVNPEAAVLLRASVEVVLEWGQTRDLARAVHTSTRTLDRRCSEAGLPPPRRLLLWMRVLLATTLLLDRGRSLESVAFGCGYASKQALRRAVHGLLGARLRDLRRANSFSLVATAFLEELQGIELQAKVA